MEELLQFLKKESALATKEWHRAIKSKNKEYELYFDGKTAAYDSIILYIEDKIILEDIRK